MFHDPLLMTKVASSGGGGGGAASIDWMGSAVSTTYQGTFTFNTQPFGAAASDREIMIVIEGDTGYATVSSATIGGVTATISTTVFAASGTAMTLIRAIVPTGASGTVVITWSAYITACVIGIYRVAGRSSPGDAPTGGGSSTGNTAGKSISSLSVAVGGFVIAGRSITSSSTGYTLSGLGTASDADVTSGYCAVRFGHSPIAESAASGSVTFGWDYERFHVVYVWIFGG